MICVWRVLVSFLILLLIEVFSAQSAFSQVKPNIVVVLTDDMRLDDTMATPRAVALLGGAGATFSNAFVGVSLCCPSRATLLTGRYPQNTGVLTNAGYSVFKANGSERATIGTWLEAAGYQTAYVGKYLNGYPGGSGGAKVVPPGWSYWAVPTSGFTDQLDYTLNVNGELRRYGSAPKDFGTDVLARHALEFIGDAAAAADPFLLVLSPFAPHSPAVAAPRHAGRFTEAKLRQTPARLERDTSDKPSFYRLPDLKPAQKATIEAGHRQRLRSLAAVDEAVEAVVGKLRATGELDNTYIVFTSDNGFKLGEHKLGVNKQTEFDADVRVPFMIRGPGVRSGTAIDELVNNADLAPTIVAWAGAKPSREPDGRSLTPLLLQRGDVVPWRRAFPVAHGIKQNQGVGRFFDAGLFKDVPYVLAPAYYGLRSAGYLFTEYGTGDRQLYDLRADPHQLRNIAGEVAASLERAVAARAKALSTCAGPRCRALEELPLPAP